MLLLVVVTLAVEPVGETADRRLTLEMYEPSPTALRQHSIVQPGAGTPEVDGSMLMPGDGGYASPVDVED